MRRVAVFFGALALLGPVAFALMGGFAGALQQDGIAVSRTATVQKSYGPIAASFPAGSVVVPTPSGCGSANPDPIEGDGPAPFQATCDTIPLHIDQPTDLAATDEFFVTVEVAWDNPTDQDDIDAYVWDNQQITKRADPENGSGYTQINSSTSSDQNPEVVKLFHPTLGDYNIVVINSSGPNLGYSIKAYMTVAKGDSIFELLDPTAALPTSSAPAAEPAPIDYSADPGLTPNLFTPPAASLGEIAVLPDADLETDFGQSTFQQAIAPPSSGLARFAAKKPEPASGLAVTLSLIVLPLAAAAAAAVVIRRRSKFGLS